MDCIKDKNCLIMIDENEYKVNLLRGEQNSMYILDKGSQKYLMCLFSNLHALFQINEKEFIVSYKEHDGTYKLKHLKSDEKSLMLPSVFEKAYNNSDNNFLISHNVVIVKNNNETTVYNYKSGNVLSIENLNIIGTKMIDEKFYLIANIKVGNIENLVTYIDANSLEFEEFYSMLQDRFVKVIEDKNLDFRNRLGMTLENEVYKYVEYIEAYEEETLSEKIIAICKKLEKKK